MKDRAQVKAESKDEDKVLALVAFVEDTSTIEDPHDGVIAMPHVEGCLWDAWRLGYASGKQDDIREVIEWLNKFKLKDGFIVDPDDQISQLRKWGVEPEPLERPVPGFPPRPSDMEKFEEKEKEREAPAKNQDQGLSENTIQSFRKIVIALKQDERIRTANHNAAEEEKRGA